MSLTTFQSAISQQSFTAYEADFSALTGEDGSGSSIGVGGDNGASTNYIFDFFAADVSMNVDPSFAVALQALDGLADVSAIAQVQTPVETFDNFISLILDSSDINDLSAEDVRFMVNSNNPFNSFSFSNSSIKFGAENVTYSDQSIPSDMVRHIAKDVTGGYAVADIFTNEKELRDDIIALDASLVEDISGSIDSLATLTSPSSTGDQGGIQFADAIDATQGITTSSQAMFFSSVHRLFAITMAASVGSGDDEKERFLNFIEDLSNDAVAVDDSGVVIDASDVVVSGSDPSKFVKVPLRFIPGDAIAVRINYRPASQQPVIGNNPITERSYKVLVELT